MLKAIPIIALVFVSLKLFAGPIENLKAGEWYEVPNSHLSSVAPSGWAADVMDPWSGGTFDTKRDRLIIWGGGHTDYSGNEIYTFDLNNLQWRRETNPSTDVGGSESSGYYPDGLPRSRHTYDYIEYAPSTDAFYSFGGGGMSPSGQTGTTNLDCYNFTTAQWERKTACPNGAGAMNNSAYDPSTGHLWFANGPRIAEYNPVSNQWTSHGSGGSYAGYHYTGDLDPVRHKMLLLGESVIAFDLMQTNINCTVQATTGGGEIVNSAASPGFVYDPIIDKMVAWKGGSSVYLLNLTTWAWSKVAPAATNSVTPASGASNGTFGRFRYCPSKNVFVVVNAINQNVFIYKLDNNPGTSAEMHQATLTENLTVSPNPLRTHTRISFSNPNKGAELSVYDVSGRLVREFKNISTTSVSLNANGLTNGVYVLKVISANAQYAKRLLVEK
jgi:hypothetical protein